MPRGRQPESQAALTNAERQARHRARRQASRPPLTIKPPRPARRSRTKRWNEALAEMLAVQAECAAWFEALPESLRDSATATALHPIFNTPQNKPHLIRPLRRPGSPSGTTSTSCGGYTVSFLTPPGAASMAKAS